jgi:hypothetical protein
MKSSNIKEANELIQHYKKLIHFRTCGGISLQYSFLFCKKSIPISMDAANICLEAERKKTEERLKELGVEFDEIVKEGIK